MPRPPMPYAGGKQNLAQRIASLMPPHHCYVEPYAGGLSVLLAKPVSRIEVANDLDEELVTFWRVLRDQPAELERMCALTPHSRALYTDCRHPFKGTSDLETAWRIWVRLTQGRGARTDTSTGWKFVAGGTTRGCVASYLDGFLARIGPAAARLRQVSLECQPALDIIHAYDRDGTLFYIDPPYMAATRYGAQYRCEMGAEDDHAALLDTLTACTGKVMLSGYRTPLYDQRLNGWHRIDMDATCMTGGRRVESLWCNYTPPRQDTLW